jgi:hypothetical protein
MYSLGDGLPTRRGRVYLDRILRSSPKLRARGFVIDEHATDEVRADWTKRGVASRYCCNVIFFRR